MTLGRGTELLYPQTSLAAHVLGFTDIDGRGRAGMERAEDDRLVREDMRDKPLVLSIDSRVQQAVEGELGAAMAKFNAIGAEIGRAHVGNRVTKGHNEGRLSHEKKKI